MTDAMNVQHGGTHYKGMVIQPFELSLANNYDSAIHSTIKYLSRHQDKGGREDLMKGSHICQIRLAMIQKGYVIPWAHSVIPITEYNEKNQIRAREATIIKNLDGWARGAVVNMSDPRICHFITQQIDALVELRYPEEDT